MWRMSVSALAAVALLAACGQASPAPVTRAQTQPSPASTTTVTPAPPHHHHHHRHHVNLGRLPQTRALPSSSTRQFRREMAGLWRGITTGRTGPALPAFFPLAAYVQVKAISYAQADWHARLIGGYAADIAAAHALLGAGAPSAHLIRVSVPTGYAHWVTPGTCYNRIGYWESPNSRVVYRERGQVRSLGIASLISWRGVWYVVHLGAVLRSGTGGVVDDPSTGPGYAAPSSIC